MPTNPDIQLVFFDIDGTLGRQGDIAANNLAALQQLHQQGTKIVIATGRGVAMLNDSIHQLFDQGIVDAYICMNGQFNRNKEKIISEYPLTTEQCEIVADILGRHGFAYKLHSQSHIAWSEMTDDYHLLIDKYPSFIVDADHHKNNTIYQCSAFISADEQTPQLEQQFTAHDMVLTRWQTRGVDILPSSAGKSRGISDVCRHFNINVENTMAFGDGLNDIDMLQHVGIGVAMGDGNPKTLAVADFITSSLEENGIPDALKHFSVL